jgi:hypothetical protein
VFNGSKTYTTEKLSEFLSLTVNQPNPFILPIDEGEQILNLAIESLEVDPFPTRNPSFLDLQSR